MTIETWLAFTIASAIVVIIPGPNIVLTVNYAIRDGLRSGLATVPGVVLGAFVAVAALNSLFWLFFANGMRAQFRKPNMMRALNRVGASCLCIAGLFTAKATRVS